jgi:hypothetical protein
MAVRDFSLYSQEEVHFIMADSSIDLGCLEPLSLSIRHVIVVQEPRRNGILKGGACKRRANTLLNTTSSSFTSVRSIESRHAMGDMPDGKS